MVCDNFWREKMNGQRSGFKILGISVSLSFLLFPFSQSQGLFLLGARSKESHRLENCFKFVLFVVCLCRSPLTTQLQAPRHRKISSAALLSKESSRSSTNSLET